LGGGFPKYFAMGPIHPHDRPIGIEVVARNRRFVKQRMERRLGLEQFLLHPAALQMVSDLRSDIGKQLQNLWIRRSGPTLEQYHDAADGFMVPNRKRQAVGDSGSFE